MEDLIGLAGLVKAEEREFGASALRPELERKERRATWLATVRDALIDMATDRLEAGRLYASTADYKDIQRLQIFRGLLLSKGMIDQAQADGVDLRYRDPEAEAEAVERAQKRRALDERFAEILNHVKPGQRTEALRLYNTASAEPRSDSKLESWRRALVDARLLTRSWLPGR